MRLTLSFVLLLVACEDTSRDISTFKPLLGKYCDVQDSLHNWVFNTTNVAFYSNPQQSVTHLAMEWHVKGNSFYNRVYKNRAAWMQHHFSIEGDTVEIGIYTYVREK